MSVRRLVVFAFAVFLASPAAAAERTVTLQVDNMTCSACPYIVQESLLGVAGALAADVSLEEKRAVVTYDDAVTGPDALAAASTEAGYPARPLP